MANKKLGLLIMILLFIAQVIFTGNMVYQQEEVVQKGKLYKFRTAPLDPNDPFRGKYIRLNFQMSQVATQDTTWVRNEEAYVFLEENENGFVTIDNITRVVPTDGRDYLQVKIRSMSHDKESVFFDYPFDRFYMEESKAPTAEKVYIESRIDTTQIAYAEVSIYRGEAVIQDVKINGRSIQEIVEEANESSER